MSSEKYFLVYPIDINPCTYSTATLHSWGLRDIDLTKAFRRMERRKLQEKRKGDITWPEKLEEHLSRIDTGPLPEMYNAIWFSISASTSTNYTGTQNHRTSKLQRNVFLGSGWEELFTRQGTPK